jgi:site-specific recombinase XerC
MTLAALHARFLQHCAVEKRLRPMTIKSYRSDFGLFLEFARRRRRTLRLRTLSPQGRGQGGGSLGLRTFTTTLIRDYQAHMATRRWSVNTVRRRLVELNRFAGWLVERRYLGRSPMIGVSVPRRERRLPRVVPLHTSSTLSPLGRGQGEGRCLYVRELARAHHQAGASAALQAREPPHRPAPAPASLPPHLRHRAAEPPREWPLTGRA